MEPGMHTLTLKAWDLFDNPSQKTIQFFVSESVVPPVTQVYNYPNPLSSGGTWFTFQPSVGGGPVDVQVQIFSLYGEPVHQFTFTMEGSQDGVQTVYWNGLNGHGAKPANGIYPYRVTFRNKTGAWSETSQKLVILN